VHRLAKIRVVVAASRALPLAGTQHVVASLVAASLAGTPHVVASLVAASLVVTVAWWSQVSQSWTWQSARSAHWS
jgi:hypothetical protein